jgi:hypothetical protein
MVRSRCWSIQSGQPTDRKILDDPAEHVLPQPEAETSAPHLSSAAVQLDIAASSQPGKARAYDEDDDLAVSAGGFLRVAMTNLRKCRVPE